MASQETFELDGKTYKVRLPNSKEREEGERIHAKAFATALKNGGFLEGNIYKVARENGLWDDEKEAAVAATRQELADKQKILDEGGIELDHAKQVALAMKELRYKLLLENFILEEIRAQSVNRKADAARQDYFVSCCVLDDKDKPVFKGLDDFYTRQNEDIVGMSAFAFQKVWYNYNEKTFSFPEDEFLAEFNLLDPAPEPVKRKPFLKDGKPILNAE